MTKLIITSLSVLSTGIIAGLLFTWCNAVMPGIKNLSDKEFINAMQAMDKQIQNPLFFFFFFGAFIFTGFYAYLEFQRPINSLWYLLLASFILYLLVVIITITGNVPLNNKLANFNIEFSSVNDFTIFRKSFEIPWNKLNLTRTVFSMFGFGLHILYLILQNKSRA